MISTLFNKLLKTYSVERYKAFRKSVLEKQLSFVRAVLIVIIAVSVICLACRFVPLYIGSDIPDVAFLYIYGSSLVFSIPFLVITMRYRKDAQNHFLLMEFCSYATISFLPLWSLLILVLSDTTTTNPNALIWSMGVLVFAGGICMLPIYTLIYSIFYFVLCGVVMTKFDIDLSSNMWVNLISLCCITAEISRIRFFREYSTFKLSQVKNELAEDAQRAKEVAEKASNAKNTFLSHISHEIRTPINAILGADEMIIRESDDPTTVSYANNIMSSGQLLLALVDDVLDMSLIESGDLEIVPSAYSFSEMISEVDRIIRPRAMAKNLTLNINVDERTPKTLKGDLVRVRQIILNLLTNAVKYTEKGSVTLKTDFTLLPHNIIELEISISDTGIGIHEQDFKFITESFSRIDNPTTRSVPGTGLGMTITSRLLEQMNGRMEIKSEIGAGSCFTVFIPQEIVDYHPGGKVKLSTAPANGPAYAPTFKADNCNILIVDDNAVNRIIGRDLLKKTGLKIDLADSGFAMLDMVKQKHYDLIFLDHFMPKMNGMETLANFRNSEHMCKGTPVIALSANSDAGAREDYLNAGFVDFLKKPIIPAQYEAMIQKYLPNNSFTAL